MPDRVRKSTSKNAQGSAEDCRRRKRYLLETYRADVDAIVFRHIWDGHLVVTPGPRPWAPDELLDLLELEQDTDLELVGREIACRCYRCGTLLVFATMTVDRIVPGAVRTAEYPKGGTYVRRNVRPACPTCNYGEGSRLRRRLAKGEKR